MKHRTLERCCPKHGNENTSVQSAIDFIIFARFKWCSLSRSFNIFYGMGYILLQGGCQVLKKLKGVLPQKQRSTKPPDQGLHLPRIAEPSKTLVSK